MALLNVENIGIRFGGLQALKEVSLSVEKGHICAVIGPNGAGKTTLFNIISGFLTPTEGKVFFKDQEIQGMPAYKLTPMGISRTFQNIRLLPEMTVLENVRLGHHDKLKQNFFSAILKTPTFKKEEAQSEEDAMEILRFVGIDHLAGEYPKNLPYGHQRKLEIARTLGHRSRAAPAGRALRGHEHGRESRPGRPHPGHQPEAGTYSAAHRARYALCHEHQPLHHGAQPGLHDCPGYP